MNPLLADNLRVLEQGARLLQGLDDAGYAVPGVAVPVGPHVRHVLDHYGCLLAGLRAGVVDYDARARDARLEQDRGLALRALEGLAQSLAGLEPAALARGVHVRCRAGARAQEDLGLVVSSGERELHFVLLHTIHHWALIKVELRLRGLPVEAELGVAPATLGYLSGPSA